MDEDKTTIEGTEYINKKPIVGAPSSYGTGSVIRELDDEGRLKRVTTSGAPLDTRNVKTPQEAATPNRIGDYYFDKTGAAQVWQNSPTDLLQKYQVAIGGTEKPAELLKPGAEALSILGGAAAGASALAIGGPAGMAVGALIGGLAGGLSNLNASREEALKQWREQDVKYDSAVSFYKDEDGSVKYKVDYQKLGTGGERSGEAVKEAQNRETQVWLGDDGRLKVKVSPIFASTARYQEMLDFISQNYAGLNKNTDNLEETLTEIRNAIDSEARDYVTNMKLYADFSHKFPNASPETIVASYATETAGYIDPTKMDDYQVTTLGDDDKVTTQSAEQFFNSVLDMDKTKRNELATKLNDIVYGDSGGYTDEQRAVAYGELQAMYAASANPEKYEDNKYQGMMDADPFVSFMNSFSPLGLNVGDVIKFVSGGAYSKQEMLNQDEWAQFFGGAAGIGAGLGLWKGASSLIERGLKLLPGTAQLYAASAAGKGYDNVMAMFAEGKTAAGVGAWAAEAAFKTLKVGTLDVVLAGAQTAVSGEDFWANFGQDFARDAALEMIFSYYDMAQMQKAVSDSTVYVYADPKTGNLRKLNTYAGEKFSTYEMSDDGLITEVEYREGLDVTQWQTRQGNTGIVLKTPGGTTVTVVDGKVEYTPGGKIVDGEVVDITENISEIPVMNSGVVNTSQGQTDIATLLERAGLPADTQVMEMSESAANSAIVAGKFAKLQGTKFGMEGYRQLFNSNAVLDVANNDALAKDGDLNAWRNAQELFVSVANNAQRNLQDIQNGVYLKDASVEWAKTIDIMGKFNYQYKYKPKTDGAYINAVLNIERAQLLNDSRVEGDTTDYVTKAVETYKDVLAAMPADRGAALQEWVAQGKKWLKAFNDSVRKSGKVDVEKLDNITETDISESIGWFPVWAKRQKYTGLLDTFRGINKERNPYRSWLRDGEWVPADKLGDPWQNMNRYMAFMTNNMGLNDMNEAAMDVYDRAGLLVDNTPTDATIRKRKLDSVKNKDELNKKLDDMVAEAKKEVKEQALTPAQYSDMMTQIYEESAIPETAEALSKDPENWNDFWNNAPAQTRKDIRSELEKTSLQTGYGINDTRARLNAQVPGADVLDPTNPANVPTKPQFVQPRRKVTYEDYQKGLQADPEMAGRIRDSYRGAMADRLVKEATRAIALAENYLGPYGYGADWQSYLNTSLIPDLQAAINQNMLPEEFQSFVQARMAQAMQDMAPYQGPEILLKSRLERVAEEWREWALKHIKAGRATQGELKEFANTHELNLPNDKRPLPNKIKHALWQMVQDGKRLPEINGLNPTAISKEMDQGLFYRMLDDTPLFQSAVKDKNELLDLISLEKNKETTDGFTMGTASTAAGLGGRYPITKFKNGKPYTRFIKYDTPGRLRIAEQTMKALNDKELLKEDGLISRTAAMFANDFRLLVTGWDPSRAIPNLFRDTTSSFMKTRFISPRKQLQAALDLGDYTPKQRANLEKAIENAANAAAGSSYNSAYRSTRSGMTEITKQYLSQNGASPMKRFFFNLRKDKRSIAEWPMEFFESYSRRANARSLAAVQLRRDQKAGKSYKEQMKNATTAADWAGREYTANFQRKGELIGRVSKYVAYQSSAYAGFDSWVRAFINDPTTVSRNFAAFVLAYLVLLADTLSREDTRKQYYRLSEYDRENQIVIGMGDSILTIPMDQTLAGMIFPYRRIMETLNGTDPVSFFEFVWGTLTAALPPDLSGFSEGDGFNLSRGLQKLAAQNMPNIASGIVEASTGLDLYYGSQTSVSDETLRNYGIYNPTAGDYTTTGNDSEILRNVANTTGIPQWQLQVMLENYGGNIGKYVLNILDKMAGAPEERQGGKDFADTVFNSFTGLDQDAASSVFYEGIQQLGQEKNALLQKISDYNESLKTASGDAKIELQNKIQQAKRDYGTKVGDFVDKYISAYEITGGLSKKQAQQVYYLFRLDDDDTIYQSGSVEEYYNNQALQQFKNQATALSAPVLDQYYNNRRGNIYQDSEGVWRRYLPSASQAMKNSIYGTGEQQMVDLLNILEGKTSNLTSYRSQIKDLRNQAYEAGDWDTRDALAYELDKKVIEAISPYIERYGAEYVLGNSDVLSYLSEWLIVPDDFIRTKKGKYVSLGNNASTQKAFVQPFIKYIFGLPTNFSSYNDTKITPKVIGEM